TVTSSKNPSLQGDNVQFTATITGNGTTPTGTVQFLTNGVAFGSPVTLSGGAASVSTAVLPLGTTTVTAQYGGDSNYAGSTNALSQLVVLPSTNTVASSENLSQLGDSVFFTATITGGGATPTGTVQFLINGTTFGGAVSLDVNGVATSASTT